MLNELLKKQKTFFYWQTGLEGEDLDKEEMDAETLMNRLTLNVRIDAGEMQQRLDGNNEGLERRSESYR